MKTTPTKVILSLIMAIAVILPADAKKDKGDHPSREQFAEVQATQIANELMLDEATSQQFITLFTQCQKEIWAAGEQEKKAKKSDKNSVMTDAEAQKEIEERFAHRRQINDIQEKYYAEFSKFLTQRQILRMYDEEKKMMDRMFHERMNHRKKTGNKSPKAPQPGAPAPNQPTE